MLFVYVIAIGHLGQVAHLTATQWQFVIATGLILLLFTVTTFTAIRRASVSAVLAIGTAAPIITTLLQVATAARRSFAVALLFGSYSLPAVSRVTAGCRNLSFIMA